MNMGSVWPDLCVHIQPLSLIFFYSKLTLPSPLHYEFKIKTVKLVAFILLILYQWYMKYPIDINFQQGYNITTSWIYSITKYPDNISGASAARESRFNVLMFWGYVRSKPPSWERWNVRKEKVHPICILNTQSRILEISISNDILATLENNIENILQAQVLHINQLRPRFWVCLHNF